MNKKLNAFRGILTPAQIAEGINAANSNAKRLTSDAERLLVSGSFATAASLAILAIEEGGKIPILRTIALAKSELEVKDCWKDYRSHTQKNVSWIFPQLVANGARKLEDFRKLFDKDLDHPYLLDQIKQLGFYTDCLGNAHWSQPTEVISKELAVSLLQTAQLLIHNRECTEREIELWVEHIGPVWKRDLEWMKQALINWSNAMQREGLMSSEENSMEKFIRKELGLDNFPSKQG